MKMNGDVDAAYVAARTALLDALAALESHIEALVLVGAQAIYMHTGAGDLAVAPYTTDADVVIIPDRLTDDPRLDEAIRTAGLLPSQEAVGTWSKTVGGATVPVDFLVPAGLAAGGGRRGARLGVHGNKVARKAVGLEAAAIDADWRWVEAIDPSDRRRFRVRVAGPAALLVAKLHKLAERIDHPSRTDRKDALDIYRLLTLDSADIADRMGCLLANHATKGVATEAIGHLKQLFGAVEASGCMLAGESVSDIMDPFEMQQSVQFLAVELLTRMSG